MVDPFTVASIGSSVIGGLFGSSSAKKANKAAAALAREQMDFQERMRDTQYQSAVKDMEAAGLNPMLAYSQGGNASPAGAMAPVLNESDSAIRGVSSALEAALSRAQLKKIDADTDASTADATLKTNSAKTAAAQERLIAMQERLLALGIPGARNEAAIQEFIGPTGKAAASMIRGLPASKIGALSRLNPFSKHSFTGNFARKVFRRK